mgnify:CR=1 FL=1
MESVFILIPISIILAFLIAYFFWWSGKNGQFDDLEGPAHRILMDDDSYHPEDESPHSNDTPPA